VSARRVVAGRYRLEERIGSGAMGVVWRGTDERLGRVVAVKQVFLNQGLDEREADEVRQRTLREGRIAARLQHAHAISVFDASIEGDEPWLVMEYLPSRSLAAVLGEEGTLDPRHAARIGRQVADALDAAHQAGIVHRDVKPGNVLIGSDGTVKITDFGISRATGDLTLTRTGVLAGTPAYLAPEVARGDDSSAASDVFSLGATLYAAVEGIPPFGADDNALALLHAVSAGQVRPPTQAGPLTALLMRLLRDDPAERPTAARARAELGRIAHSAPADDLDSGGGRPATAELPGPRTGPDRGSGSAPTPTRRGLPLPDLDDPRSRTPVAAAVAGPARADEGARPAAQPAPAPVRGRARSDRAAPGGRPSRTVAIVVVVLALLAGAGLGIVLLATSAEEGSGSTLGAETGAAQDPSAAMVIAVREYYDVVTGNNAAGWARLGPTLQAQAGGFSAYQGFWSTISTARVADATATDASTVRATVVFTPRSRPSTREVHDLGMVRTPDGRWLIDSDRLTS
jgi:eukaryotic-like serine/threonine-protein kinase